MGDACERVLEKSMSGGEKDNLSIVCLRCESGLAHGETDDELGIPGLMGKLRMMASTAEDLQ
jgi:hypothetical protein